MARTVEPAAIVLAAGMGTRMKSDLIKVLHPLCGRPMIGHILDAIRKAGIHKIVVVVGHQAAAVQAAVGPGVEYVFQAEQLGTGHAVAQAQPKLADHDGPVLVTYGDTVLYRSETLAAFVEEHLSRGSAAGVLTAVVEDPTGYGRIIRTVPADGKLGELDRIVEQKDASPSEAVICEINTGTYCFDGRLLFKALAELRPANAQSEFYLPDVFPIIRSWGHTALASPIGDPEEALGVNDRVQLAQAETILRGRIRNALMREGVTLEQPETIQIDAGVSIGRDTVIRARTTIEGSTRIGSGCVVGPGAYLKDAQIADGAKIAAGAHVIREHF